MFNAKNVQNIVESKKTSFDQPDTSLYGYITLPFVEKVEGKTTRRVIRLSKKARTNLGITDAKVDQYITFSTDYGEGKSFIIAQCKKEDVVVTADGKMTPRKITKKSHNITSNLFAKVIENSFELNDGVENTLYLEGMIEPYVYELTVTPQMATIADSVTEELTEKGLDVGETETYEGDAEAAEIADEIFDAISTDA